jgi:AmmeMemoRadiSam system protein B/AmmeMemoRadiSam system protein A
MFTVSGYNCFKNCSPGRWIVVLALALGAAWINPIRAGGETVRPAVWAGKFYPAESWALKAAIDDLMRRTGRSRSDLPKDKSLRALILPHAGYIYSGLTAAHGTMELMGRHYQKVILLGPDHRIGFANCAVSRADAFETPLGKIPIHAAATLLRQDETLFRANLASDQKEHSLEVILPFLQTALKEFGLIPVVVGPCDADRVAHRIDPLLDPATLLVVSTDLSHYLPYDRAVRRDRETIGIILKLEQGRLKTSANRACGVFALEVLIRLARRNQWQPILLHYANSGDTAGDRKAVVGYAAIAFYGDAMHKNKTQGREELTPQQGQLLVRLARKTIREKLNLPPSSEETQVDPAALADEAFKARCGTFVTLKIDDNLRGCIGSLIAEEPIADGVRENAINAAFHDPRFRALTPGEYSRVDIEVSILSEPESLPYKDADDLLAKLRVNVDGVILRKGAHKATFLPQVWKQLPRPEDFLGHLCMKAGLAADEWQKGAIEISTYQVQYFEE